MFLEVGDDIIKVDTLVSHVHLLLSVLDPGLQLVLKRVVLEAVGLVGLEVLAALGQLAGQRVQQHARLAQLLHQRGRQSLVVTYALLHAAHLLQLSLHVGGQSLSDHGTMWLIKLRLGPWWIKRCLRGVTPEKYVMGDKSTASS